MKKTFSVILCVLLVLAMVLSMAACKPAEEEKKKENIFNKVPKHNLDYNPEDAQSILDALAECFVTSTEFVEDNMVKLRTVLGESYATYKENAYVVPDFYKNLQKVSDKLYEVAEDISEDYFRLMAKSGKGDHETWESALETYWTLWNTNITAYGEFWRNCTEEVYDLCEGLIATVVGTELKDEYSTAWTPMYTSYLNIIYSMEQDYATVTGFGLINYQSILEGFNAGNMDVDAILDEAADKELPTEPSEPSEPTEETKGDENQNTFTSECIEVLNNYEAFVVEYCEFMKEYVGATSSSMQKKYAQYIKQLQQYNEALSVWTEETMSEYELYYYEGVMYRCNALLESLEQN